MNEMTTAAGTFAAWLAACLASHKGPMASNCLRTAEGVKYYLDPNPRALRNGALEGRITRHVAGHGLRDVGAFKIAADGSVVRIPAELASALPGASSAAEQTEGELAIGEAQS